jgi:hypothetical protein
MAVHETVVLRLIVGRAAGRDRLTNHLLDFGPAFESQADQDFAVLRGSQISFGEKVLNFASVNSMTKISSVTIMHVAVSSVNC